MSRERAPYHLQRFVQLRSQVEGVIQHVGLATWDLLLIDVDGNWTRDEFPSDERAREVGAQLGIRVHDGWNDPRIARRMSSRDHWSAPDGQRRAL